MSIHRVRVRGVPDWVPVDRLLDAGEWRRDDGAWCGERSRDDAADLHARLRGVGLDGALLEVEVRPRLKRPVVRRARTQDARRRRDTTPGFLRAGARADDEGRWSLTPEALAVALGRRAAGRSVLDAGCGVGGMTVGFARAGCRVIAVERDATRLACARHNLGLYGVLHQVRLELSDLTSALEAHRTDLVFLDPPWGTGWNRQGCGLADLNPLADWLSLVTRTRTAPEVWIKVPPSFCTADLPGCRPRAWFGAASGDRQRVKFVLLEWNPPHSTGLLEPSVV